MLERLLYRLDSRFAARVSASLVEVLCDEVYEMDHGKLMASE